MVELSSIVGDPDEAKVEHELLPRFAQLNNATTPGFYTRYNHTELTAIRDFVS